jgi:hypothetical protein
LHQDIWLLFQLFLLDEYSIIIAGSETSTNIHENECVSLESGGRGAIPEADIILSGFWLHYDEFRCLIIPDLATPRNILDLSEIAAEDKADQCRGKELVFIGENSNWDSQTPDR